MRLYLKLFYNCLFIIMLTFVGCSDQPFTQHTNPPPNDQEVTTNEIGTTQSAQVKKAEHRYIVTFKEQPEQVADVETAQQAVEQIGSVMAATRVPQDSLIHKYKWASRGFAGRFTKKQVNRLRQHPLVKHVVKDVMYRAASYNQKSLKKSISSQTSYPTVPWGINRINAPVPTSSNKAWVIDSGVDLNHPDLNVDQNLTTSFLANQGSNDIYGHGTHVAGIIAAKDNAIDVVGVTPGTQVVGVKVCNEYGQCYVSDVKAGIDYVANKFSAGDVANISLEYPTDDPSYPRIDIPLSDMENAIKNAAISGLKFTLIAGNSSEDANLTSPGRIEHSNVWTVSAYDSNDQFASFSNYGNPPIEYSAPGVNVESLWENGGTNTGSGTSAAAPHLAGLLLAVPQEIIIDGYVSGDPDGNADPIAVHDPHLEVSISGPGTLNSGSQGTWTAVPAHAEGTVSYQWYYKANHNDSWHSAGTNTDTFSYTFFNTSSTVNTANVRVDISSSGEQTSYNKQVSVSPSGDDCDDVIICK